MSTVKADFFTWRNGEATAQVSPTITGQQLVRGVAKSWLNYDGITPAVRASFNVSSVTKNTTGDYTINFTNSLLDANYTCAGLFGTNGYLGRSYDDATARTVLLFRIVVFNLAGANQDATFVQITNDR